MLCLAVRTVCLCHVPAVLCCAHAVPVPLLCQSCACAVRTMSMRRHRAVPVLSAVPVLCHAVYYFSEGIYRFSCSRAGATMHPTVLRSKP